MDLARASLNSITVRAAPFPRLLTLATRHGFGGVALWRDVYADVGARAAASRVRDAGLRVSSVCRGGMFVHDGETELLAARDDNLRAIDEARDLEAACLVLVCGGMRGHDLAGARAQIRDGIAALAPVAAAAGVTLAIEPMHPMMIADRSAITSLREANELIDALGPEGVGVGIALDAYHVFWEAGYEAEVSRAAGRIRSVQVCDWVTPIEGQLSSRGMPGEGSIDLGGFVRAADAAGYEGLIEIEVLSDHWWSRPPAEAAGAAARGFAAL